MIGGEGKKDVTIKEEYTYTSVSQVNIVISVSVHRQQSKIPYHDSLSHYFCFQLHNMIDQILLTKGNLWISFWAKAQFAKECQKQTVSQRILCSMQSVRLIFHRFQHCICIYYSTLVVCWTKYKLRMDFWMDTAFV